MPTPELPPGDAEPGEGEAQSPRAEPEVVEEGPESSTFHIAGEVIHRRVSIRQAPYPTPEDLQEYERIHPGFTDRILTLTEREAAHRIEQERLEDNATIALARRGQTYAFIVVMTLVLGAVAAIVTDHSIVGFAGLVLAAATLAGIFVAPRLFSAKAQPDDESLPGTEIEGAD